MAIHQVSTKHVWVHVHSPTRRIMSILLRFVLRIAIVFSPAGRFVTCVPVLYCTYIVFPTNIDKCHVSVKHVTVTVVYSLVGFLYWTPMNDVLCIPPCLACVFKVVLFQFVPNLEVIPPVGFHKSVAASLFKRAIMIDHRKKKKTLSYVSVLTVAGSQMCTTSAVCGSRGVEQGSMLRRTSLRVQVKETISPSQRCLVC